MISKEKFALNLVVFSYSLGFYKSKSFVWGLDKPINFRLLALPRGMDFRWHSDCSPGFIPTHSTLA